MFIVRFKEESIERKFAKQHAGKSLLQLRFGIVLAIVLCASFAFLDSIVTGPLKLSLWQIRFFFMIPCLILAFILTFFKFSKSYLQFIGTFTVMVCAAGALLMLALLNPPWLFLYPQALILVLILNYTFLRLKFCYATVNGIIIIALFELVGLRINPLPSHILLNDTFFLVSAAIVGMVVAYFIENLERKNFLSSLLLKQMAETDELTGVMNRNSLFKALNFELRNIMKFGGVLTFCMLDLDNFKEVNDFFGHLRGDDLLKKFGRILSANFRATDLIGRLGGDEFGIVLLVLSEPQRIIEAFRKAKEEFFDVQDNLEEKVTFSVGCIIVNSSDPIEDELFYYSLADIALSTSKKRKDSLCIIGSDKQILYFNII